MTTRYSAEPDRHEPAAGADHPVMARAADEGPYARPAVPQRQAVDAVLIDAIRASVGPFVPAPWRSASGAGAGAVAAAPTPVHVEAFETPAGPAVALPWIDAFLDTAPPDAAVVEDVEAYEPPVVKEVEAVEAEQGTVVQDVVVPDDVVPTAEEWPLEEAGEAMRAIGDDLERHDAAVSHVDREIEPPVAITPPLPMWGDDDMNIMPVKTPPASDEHGAHWAAREQRDTERSSHPETAAQALEALAQRVRSGEIQLPGFSPEMGEAAALAAALSALLSARR